MLRILSIGNSFSQDAQTYLYRIARAEGVEMKTMNLYIGGCSLERHYRNMLGDRKEYTVHFNGVDTGLPITIRDALTFATWDIVTLQQSSPLSPDFETYSPYLEAIAAEVRRCQPKAKLWIHETWGYQTGYDRLVRMGYADMKDMSLPIFAAYEKAAETVKADGIIRAGEAMLKMNEAGVEPHRDGFHAGLGAARYLLGCVWFCALTGRRVTNEAFADFDVPTSPEEAALARKIANEFAK